MAEHSFWLPTHTAGSRDLRLYAPSVVRNRDPIKAVLRRVVPPAGLVLEIGSGSGEHVVHFAQALPGLRWQPSDADREACESVASWTRAAQVEDRVLPPLHFDASAAWPPMEPLAAILSINMVHIAPYAACEGLFRGAAAALPPGGPLCLYGPFLTGQGDAPSNISFDRMLRRHDPAWGVRSLQAVQATAAEQGLALDEMVEMPSNNLLLVFKPRTSVV
ncbi:hypothetical protein WJX81_002591 [Elliptochloris bilobata]|uniref:SAM-dependent methyltransferase n=1 Tax=Elliptochloris bilobata TaxID=381761 RepID=A0AAW1S3X0_9CHLO